MSIPADLKYTESHEWVRTESDGTKTTTTKDGKITVQRPDGSSEPASMRFFWYQSTVKLVIGSSRMAPKNGFRCDPLGLRPRAGLALEPRNQLREMLRPGPAKHDPRGAPNLAKYIMPSHGVARLTPKTSTQALRRPSSRGATSSPMPS